MTRNLIEIPYYANSELIFDSLAGQPWAVFLDSAQPHAQSGRYDILAADPYITIVSQDRLTKITTRTQCMEKSGDPLDILREQLKPQSTGELGSQTLSSLPFIGGAIGYFSYDLGRYYENIPTLAEDREMLPEMAIGIYDWALVVDHLELKSWLATNRRDTKTASIWSDLIQTFSAPPKPKARTKFNLASELRSNLTPAQYGAAFSRIKSYIKEGDCYQVNLAQRFEATTTGDPWLAYCHLRKLNGAPFGAYLNTPFAQILSVSPERFLKVQGGQVETKPIKGTRARGQTPEQDKQLMHALLASEKDRAENLMIVDLLRNDLGKNCVPGSVKVPKLFEIETFETVHHLVSTVVGKLLPDKDALNLLRGCFPGGSITGAPKVRAMEIIEELEPHRRGVYCGSIGYVGFDGNMDSNIAIRTLIHSEGKIRFWAGGGIVADSEQAAEYQETYDKVAAFLSLLTPSNSRHASR